MNKIEKNTELNQYFITYKSLLNPTSREIYEQYYYEDYSINEIAQNNNLSKTAVFNSLKRTEKKLLEWEAKLKVIAKIEKLVKILEENEIKVDLIEEGIYEE